MNTAALMCNAMCALRSEEEKYVRLMILGRQTLIIKHILYSMPIGQNGQSLIFH